ncbi:nucleobindin-2-like [Actinia tenebrosa]|uniref:Nucleobindin-2-like n=1 Tax=Actinia tenebrosa TaxID=6105 RepID=A0A6P8IEY0_ACTTE|nr:nucleobindin-2-like [Actinia tenebrosa]
MSGNSVFWGLIGILLVITCCYAPPVNKKKPSPEKEEEDLPEYARYLKQVVQILEQDEDYVQKLMNASDADLRSGKVADDLDLVKYDVRTKLDELKRQEIERQRMIRRQMNDHNSGLKEREHWNPVFDDDNPDFFGPEDFKKLLSKHHDEMDKRDADRREEYKKHELQKEHERRAELKKMDEEHRKEAEKKHEELMKKHAEEAKNLHHPGSKAQLEQVWEESDGLDKKDFDPRTFFQLHDVNGDGYLDTGELEALFVKEVARLYNPKDEGYDPVERDEEIARMREHVMNEIDKDKDGFVSKDEFLSASKSDEFEKDEGWKGIDEERPYTDDELAEFEKSLDQAEKHRDAQKEGTTEQHDQQQQQHDEQQKQEHH